VCNTKITRITGWRLHHCVPRVMGGSQSDALGDSAAESSHGWPMGKSGELPNLGLYSMTF